MYLKILLSFLLYCMAFGVITNYDGYKIYDIFARNHHEKQILLHLSEHPNYDFFTLPRAIDQPARVMVLPEGQVLFEELLHRYGLEYVLVNHNFGESNEEYVGDKEPVSSPRESLREIRGISFNTFYRFDEINAYLDALQSSYPSRVSVQTVGQSYEQRDMKTITITNGDNMPNKNIIFIDAGIHAREWIAPATALYVIYQLVENFDANSDLLQTYDWVVLPVVNPDGYEYTHTHTRMWRKTRKPVTKNCVGTDGNRNFDFHWGEVGASSYSCADNFKGQSAFSEPETQAVRDLLLAFSGRGKFYLTLHSYGNYLLYPWGWTSALPTSWRQNDEIARVGAKAIRAATGTKYTVGSSTNVLYAAAGGSDDYAFGVAKFPVSLTMELPPGGSGFDPSPNQIEPFASEAWIGIKAMAQRIIQKY